MAAVTICSDFGAQKIKSVTVSIVSPSICHEVMGPDVMIFVFWMLSFKPTFPLSSFTFIKRLFSFSLSAISVVSSAYLRLLIFFLVNISTAFFIEIKKIQLIWNHKRPKVAKSTLKKMNKRGTHFLISKYIAKLQLIKTAWYWHKDKHRDQWNRTVSPETNPSM